MKSKILLPLILILFNIHLFAQSDSIGSGLAFKFDNDTNSYIELGGSQFRNLNIPITVECWMKLNSYPLPKQTYAVFATDNYDPGSSRHVLYGFWVLIHSNGTVSAEMGSGGLGAGQYDQGGKQTLSPVPLHKWFHLAISFHFASYVIFYINGDSVHTERVGQYFSSSYLNHSTGNGAIGYWKTQKGTSSFDGEIDEIRLWGSGGRSQTQIRNDMCSKIKTLPSNLIGYWKADESFSSSMVNNYVTYGYPGTIVGNVTRVISGAAIGDTSVNLYTSNWAGQTMNLSSKHDKIAVKDIQNMPYGVHVYAIHAAPFVTSGLADNAQAYFGVFTVNSAKTTKYRITYTYSPLDGIVTSENKENAELFSKPDDSAAAWSNFSEIKDTALNQIRDTLIKTSMEYILNVPTGFMLPEKLIANSAPVNLTASPNPFSNELRVFGNWDEIKISNNLGKIIFDTRSLKNNLTIINTSSWSPGMYYLITKLKGEVSAEKIILSR